MSEINARERYDGQKRWMHQYRLRYGQISTHLAIGYFARDPLDRDLKLPNWIAMDTWYGLVGCEM